MAKIRPLNELKESQYLSIPESAVYLGISKHTLYRWLSEGKLGDKLHKYSFNGYNIALDRDELDALASQKELHE